MTDIENEKEKSIAICVKSAIDKLEDYPEIDNKQIVRELAQNLEGIIPIDTICLEICKRLQRILKPRTIRYYLDKKYKINYRIKNATMQKDKQSSVKKPPRPNRVGEIYEQESLSIQDSENMKNVQVKDSLIENTPLEQLEELLQLPRQQKKVKQSERTSAADEKKYKNSKLNEKIESLYAENSECQEIIKRFNPVTTADNIIIFEETISIKEIIDSVRSSRIISIDDSIRFKIEFDKNTGRILYFGPVKEDKPCLSSFKKDVLH